MYFWNITALKEDLIADSVTERNRLGYFLWSGGMYVLGAFPLGDANMWDRLDWVGMLIVFVFGSLYAYRCNALGDGRDFLTRIIALGWVFGVRFTVSIVIPVVIAAFVIEEIAMGEVAETTTPFQTAALILLEVVFYWRLGHHVKDVAS
jgi:hypothetical protein